MDRRLTILGVVAVGGCSPAPIDLERCLMLRFESDLPLEEVAQHIRQDVDLPDDYDCVVYFIYGSDGALRGEITQRVVSRERDWWFWSVAEITPNGDDDARISLTLPNPRHHRE